MVFLLAVGRWTHCVLTKTPITQVSWPRTRKTIVLNLNILQFPCIVSLTYLITNQLNTQSSIPYFVTLYSDLRADPIGRVV